MSTPLPDRVPCPPDGAGPGGRPRRVPALVAAGLALSAAAGFAVRGLWPPAAGPARPATVPVPAAHVVRTDVSARQVVAGTLGYRGRYEVANEAGPGIITWLPSAGDIVRRGQPLFRLAGQPVTLLYGRVPAWRTFAPGMAPGQDVRELQRNLAALGFAPGPADGRLGWSTEAAIGRWQQARGLTVTGTIPLGTVVFLPGRLRVAATAVPLGGPAAVGAAVLSGTSDAPAVLAWLAVGGPPVKPGDAVLVTLPDGSTTVPGTVAALGRVAVPGGGLNGTAAGGGTGPAGSGQGSGAAEPAAIPVTVTVPRSRLLAGLDQAPVQVAITQQRDRDVLAVPVTALLAVPGGGYAVRLAGQRHRLIPVTTGLFDDATGLVEVTGGGLAPGLAVQAARG